MAETSGRHAVTGRGARALLSAVGVAMGAGAFVATQAVSKTYMDPIAAACAAGPAEAAKLGLHAYEARLGNTFACIIINFIADLVKSAAGKLIWALIMCISFPFTLLLNADAGRTGARGPVRYPTVTCFLGQVLGISVVFPLLFLPGYAYGGSDGPVSVGRVRTAAALQVLPILLTILVFTLSDATYAWTLSAGLLTSPLLALPGLALWAFPPPTDTSSSVRARGALALSRTYAAFFGLSLIVWLYVLQLGAANFGSAGQLWDALWTNAHPAVAFMTIDTAVLYAALLAYLAPTGIAGTLVALALTPLLGPGAACCAVLAHREREVARAHAKLAESSASGKKGK